MVFVAALIAPDGRLAVDVLFPDRREAMAKARPGILRKYENHTFVQRDEDLAFIDGLVPLRDAVQAQSVEAMNLLFHPVSWAGVSEHMPRTFVRPLRDQHQPRRPDPGSHQPAGRNARESRSDGAGAGIARPLVAPA